MTKKPKAAPAKNKSASPLKESKKAHVAATKTEKHPMRRLRKDIEHLFENFERDFGVWPSWQRLFNIEPFFEPFRRFEPLGSGKQPVADLVENDREFRVKAELPGMTDENVEVTFSEGLLTIKGEKEEKREEKDEDYHLSERHYGSFRRSFSLPQSIDAGKVEASMKDGVLTVILPKRPEAKKEAKKISVAKG